MSYGMRERVRSRLAGAMLLAAALGFGAAVAHAQTANDTTHAFYAWVLAHPWRAIPSPKERAELSKLLSPELSRLLQSAADMEARCVKAAPKDEKPWIIEGDLFVGNLEGATEVAYGDSRPEGDAVVADVDLMYVDRRFPKAHKHRTVAWKDSLELRQADGRWRVSDVRFAGGRSLQQELRSYLDEGARTCAAR
ncbi:MAG: hypothetical protein ACXWJM_16010 [Ramlibacter sp.]